MTEKLEKDKSILGLFRSYYRSEFKKDELYLGSVKFRHFRFELFSQKVCFERIKDIFKREEEIKEKIIQLIPRNAYHTPVKWLNPIYVAKTKTEIDVMLSSPLYFDIDLDIKTTKSFGTAKFALTELLNYIEKRFAMHPDLIVFSGRKGFHVYYWEWDFDKMVNLPPIERISFFIRERKKILSDLEVAGILVDPAVTADPYRLMKISNTLHGKTGLIARPVRNISTFNPIIHCKAFDKNHYEGLFNADLQFYDTS